MINDWRFSKDIQISNQHSLIGNRKSNGVNGLKNDD